MTTLDGNAGRFLALHHGDRPLLQPNAWDAGSARVLETLGFEAIATTSSGFAATLGRLDGEITRDDALAHCRALSTAVDIPVAADAENGFADDPAGVTETVTLLTRTGLAGCSIEDWSGGPDGRIYDGALATERIAAAAEAAHRGPTHLVLTARAENLLHGVPDLDDTIARLQAYRDAGADVLFAPGLPDGDAIRAVVQSVDAPVNVLVRPGHPTIDELAEIGVARVSVGGAFAFAALAALIDGATELRDRGTYDFANPAGRARPIVADALSRPRS